jgi:hypothetical protein
VTFTANGISNQRQKEREREGERERERERVNNRRKEGMKVRKS